jgi:hypothetical protein
VPELLSLVAEVHSDMSNAAKPLVLLRRHGIKKGRFIERSGLDGKFSVVLGIFQRMFFTKLFQCHFLAQQVERTVDPA